jgi:hypothetical protein
MAWTLVPQAGMHQSTAHAAIGWLVLGVLLDQVSVCRWVTAVSGPGPQASCTQNFRGERQPARSDVLFINAVSHERQNKKPDSHVDTVWRSGWIMTDGSQFAF